MRWAIIGASGPDTFEFHLQDTLQHMGHEVRLFDLTLGAYKGRLIHYWVRRISEAYDRKKARMVANSILRAEPDIVLAVYRHIHPDTIAYIKRERPDLPVIHVNQDNLTTLEQQQVLASNYDCIFTKDPYLAKTFRDKAGLNAHYLPESFNPRVHRPPAVNRREIEKELDLDVLVFGTFYPYRNRFVEGILRPGRKIRLYGSEGPFFPDRLRPYFAGHVILHEEKSRLLYGARIVLNNFFYGEIEGVNCKYFEINGIGAFQLCDFKAVLHEYSPVTPAAYSFTSLEEVNDLIAKYVDKPDLRYEIAEQQRQHFLANHTYEHRIQTILESIGRGGKSASRVIYGMD